MDTRKQRDVTRDAADEVAGADRHPVGLPGSALEVLLVYFKLGVSSFGGPIAHGYLTLSLIPVLLGGVMKVDGVAMGVNYGTNKVRFTSPVPVGSAIRAGATLASVEEVPGGVQVALDVVVEVKDAPKPSCVAQVVFRYYR